MKPCQIFRTVIAVSLACGSLLNACSSYSDSTKGSKTKTTTPYKVLDPSPKVVELTKNALSSFSKDDLATAEQNYRLALNETVDDDPQTAITQHGLACVYLKQGKFAEAQELLEKAVINLQSSLGPDCTHLAKAYNDLAVAYVQQNNLAKAEETLLKAIAVAEKNKDVRAETISRSHSDLGSLYVKSSRFDKAEPLLLSALKLREQLLGLQSPATCFVAEQLAYMYVNSGKAAEAENLLKRFVEVCQQKNVESLDAARIYSYYSFALQQQHKWDAALLYANKCLHVQKKNWGDNDKDLAATFDTIAAIEAAQKKVGDAEAHLKRALLLREKGSPPDHVQLAESSKRLAYFYKEVKDLKNAAQFFRRALDEIQKTPADSVVVAGYTDDLAYFLRDHGDLSNSEKMFQQALELRQKALGITDKAVYLSAKNLAKVYELRGNKEKAEDLMNQYRYSNVRRQQRS